MRLKAATGVKGVTPSASANRRSRQSSLRIKTQREGRYYGCKERCRAIQSEGRQMLDANFPVDEEGRTFHLSAREGDISNRILSVGDASRAELLSQFLEPFPNGKPVFNMVSSRGFGITTGMMGGKEVSIVTTLMGMPNMDFVVREARAVVNGPIAIVRLGTCGALQSGTLGKIQVPTDGCVWVHRNPDAFSPTNSSEAPPYRISKPTFPDAKLCEDLVIELKKELGTAGVNCGVNCTTDSFYSSQGRQTTYFEDHNEDLMERVLREIPNAVSFEMETFQLLHLASCSRGTIAAASCAIGLAERASNDFMTPSDLLEKEQKAGKAALNALVGFNISQLNS